MSFESDRIYSRLKTQNSQRHWEFCPEQHRNGAARRSSRQRVGTKLNFDGPRPVLFAAFEMEIGSAAIGRPQFLTFPPGIRIVDAAINILGEEAHRIRDREIDELAGHQGQYRAVEVTHDDR